MRALFGLMLVASCLPAAAIELSNFKSGLACTNTRLPEGDPQGWICHSTVKVFVTDQGVCKYNGEKEVCTWVGFEFDYRNAEKDQKLQCRTTSSQPSDSGNPREVVAEGVTSEDWELPLAPGAGHFFNPQYMFFNTRAPGRSDPHVQVTTCSASGKVLFESRFEFIFPEYKRPEA